MARTLEVSKDERRKEEEEKRGEEEKKKKPVSNARPRRDPNKKTQRTEKKVLPFQRHATDYRTTSSSIL